MDKLEEIARRLAEIDDPELMERFFREILTPKEVRDLSSRWELVKLLEEGVSQRRIAKDLHLSLCKITRGSRELKKRNSALKKIIREFID
ncbi:MAG: Trp family transcriptional regulator [Candidatus Euphemobacter frigidus]|nr:Trp family transcriptional regulator [Candidatus Euphemobacter frigidus]MDP8275694.1 Trp family transcriptional regulator [Candidatus Euphemobacter frigidus]